jgi:hypothetical protein
MNENAPRLQEQNPHHPRHPRRLGLYLPVGLLALVIAGWTGLWFFSANFAGRIADGFIEREAERGRVWDCPNRVVGGYPFRISISCDQPKLVLQGPDGVGREGSLAGFSLHARILSPGHFVAVLSPPFIARQGSERDMEITWKSARASVIAGTESISEASVEILEPQMSAGRGDRQDIKALAKALDVHLRHSPGNVPGTDLAMKMNELTFAPFDQLTGTPDPIRLELQLTAPGLIMNPKKKPQEVVEEWRITGQKARIVTLQMIKGAANIDLAGVMGLDDEHRPEGNLQGRAKGLDALLGRLTRRGGIDVGGILGRLGGNQGLPVALSFQDGRLRFGPFPIADLPPLY